MPGLGYQRINRLDMWMNVISFFLWNYKFSGVFLMQNTVIGFLCMRLKNDGFEKKY